MRLDPNLHKTVLAGTTRAAFDAAAGAAAPLRPMLQQEQDHGSALWLSLAAQDTWQRAGYVPQTTLDKAAASDANAAEGANAASAGPVASGRDTAPRCPRAAEDVLHMILRGIHAELLPAWLDLARTHGLSLPHACLVPLIEQSLTRPGLREQLAPLLGARGRWLVAQNPEWGQRYDGAACG